MFKKMGRTCPTWLVVLRAHVIHDVDRHQRRLVVLVQYDGQAVVETVFLNFQLRDQRIVRRRWGRVWWQWTVAGATQTTKVAISWVNNRIVGLMQFDLSQIPSIRCTRIATNFRYSQARSLN